MDNGIYAEQPARRNAHGERGVALITVLLITAI